MRFWPIFVAVGLMLASALGLLVMSGHARGLLAPGLQAELVAQDFPLPPDMGVDPNEVAEFMAAELQERLMQDVAVRLTLGEEVRRKVRDIVLPRLMNVVVVRSMMNGIPDLEALLDLGDFRRSVSGVVYTKGPAADVALTVPGALLATIDGVIAPVVTTSTGMTALELGDMAAGERHDIVVWLDESAVSVNLGRTVRLGAADGQRGRVLLSGERGWFGSDAEPLRWGRWLIGAVLFSVLVFSIAFLLVPLLSARQARRRPAAVRAPGHS